MLIKIQHGDHLKILPFISNGGLVFYKEVCMVHLQRQDMDFTGIYDSPDGMLKRLSYYHYKTDYDDYVNKTKFSRVSKKWIFAFLREGHIYFTQVGKKLAEMIIEGMRGETKVNPFVTVDVVESNTQQYGFKSLRFVSYEQSRIGNWCPDFEHSSVSDVMNFVSNKQDSIDNFLFKRNVANRIDVIRHHYGDIYDNFISSERDKKINSIIDE